MVRDMAMHYTSPTQNIATAFGMAHQLRLVARDDVFGQASGLNPVVGRCGSVRINLWQL